MGTAEISVVIPAYNAARFLGEALDSALTQTRNPAEIIVVVDGSEDASAEIARSFGPIVRVLHQARSGVSRARNAGIAAAAGEFIAFLDADDRWEPTRLEKQLAAMRAQPDASWGFCWYYEFSDESRSLPSIPAALERGTFDPELLTPDVTVLPSAAMVRASVPVRYPEWTKNNEDTVYFNELLRHGPFVFVAEPLVAYRRHAASAQKQPGAVERACETMLQWVEQQPADRQARMRAKVVAALARQAEAAKWRRDWDSHGVLRAFCITHWPQGSPMPRVLTETLWPRLAYSAKDCVDRIRGVSA